MAFGAYICETCQITLPVPDDDLFRLWPWWLAHHEHSLVWCSEEECEAMEAAIKLASHGLQVYETTDLAGLVDWMPTTADAHAKCIM